MFQKIKNIISLKAIRRKKGNYEISPKRDWAILVSLFFLANILLLFVLVFNYFKIANESGSGDLSTIEKIDPLDLGSVESVLEYIKEKEIRYQTLLEEKPETSDPSI